MGGLQVSKSSALAYRGKGVEGVTVSWNVFSVEVMPSCRSAGGSVVRMVTTRRTKESMHYADMPTGIYKAGKTAQNSGESW